MAEVDLGPGILAFFTTAHGGMSQPPYASMNVGAAVGDAAESVKANREAIEALVGAQVVYLNQVHGSKVVESDLFTNGAQGAAIDADGHTSKTPGQALGVYVADCVPVLLADPLNGVVGAAHAGRPGLEAKVISATVENMISRGASRGEIRAVIGPCICANCYEVPAEMALGFAESTSTKVSKTRWQTPGISLREAAQTELECCGVVSIMHVDQCTYDLADRDGSLFSHRWATHNRDRTEGKSGRFAGIIRLV